MAPHLSDDELGGERERERNNNNNNPISYSGKYGTVHKHKNTSTEWLLSF